MLNNISILEGVSVLGALLVSLVMLTFGWSIGTRLEVVDHPDNGRKMHARPTPLVGGIAIIVPLLLWAAGGLFWPNMIGGTPIPLAVLVCGGGAALIGFIDDRSSVSPIVRLLILMALTVAALVISPQLLPARFHWSLLASTPVAPWLSYGLVAIGMAGFVNSVNMADGHDGCVAGMFAIWSACILWAGSGAADDVAGVMFVTSAAVLAFNLSGKVFLGGAGAYGVTFVFGLLILYLHNSWGLTAETVIVWFFLPVVDCLRLLIQRPLQGRSPFEADRNHFHHRLHERFGKLGGLAVYLGLVAASSFTVALQPGLAPFCLAALACAYVGLMLLTGANAAAAAPVKIAPRD
jgi:UDP-GlcNAc:undecaprenyl-phosphate GlcNAc-1-phosphate transferase